MLFVTCFCYFFLGGGGGGGGGGEEMFICSDVFFSEPTYNSKTTAEPLTIFVVHAHSEWPYVFLTPCRFWLQ